MMLYDWHATPDEKSRSDSVQAYCVSCEVVPMPEQDMQCPDCKREYAARHEAELEHIWQSMLAVVREENPR